MHDFITSKEILDQVLRAAKRNHFKKVVRVEIGLGKMEAHGETIAPSNIKFNFKMLAKGTVAESAKIVISRISGEIYKITAVEGVIGPIKSARLKVSTKVVAKAHQHGQPMTEAEHKRWHEQHSK